MLYIPGTEKKGHIVVAGGPRRLQATQHGTSLAPGRSVRRLSVSLTPKFFQPTSSSSNFKWWLYRLLIHSLSTFVKRSRQNFFSSFEILVNFDNRVVSRFCDKFNHHRSQLLMLFIPGTDKKSPPRLRRWPASAASNAARHQPITRHLCATSER